MIDTPDLMAPERAKYETMWAHPDYGKYSPGMEDLDRFWEVLHPTPFSSLIDIGCGPGKAGLEFVNRRLCVTWLDLTDAALDPAVPRERFIQAPLHARWKRAPGWDYGYCCDVLEHIAPEFTMLCLERITHACRTAWLRISFRRDEFGKEIGQPLHLTVKPFTWWRDRVAEFGKLTDARDLCGYGVFVVKR